MNWIKGIIYFFCFFCLTAYAEESKTPSHMIQNRILFLMQKGNIDDALNLYRDYHSQLGSHDAELLQQIGLALLEKGYRSGDAETQLLTLFGAGISFNEKALHLLEEGMSNSHPQLQLVALGFLSRFQNDEADQAMSRALASQFLVIRLEGAHHLLKRKVPNAVMQTEALMCKVPAEILPLFPQLFALSGTVEATRILRKFISHSDEKVRIETVLNAAKHGRDDLLPRIRILSTQHSILQQEACALAMGILKDESSVDKLQQLVASKSPYVRLTALSSLYRLGREEATVEIRKAAQAQDLFAITLLGEIPNSESELYALLQSPNAQVKVNAALALLKHHDARCLPALTSLLIRDSRDLAVGRIYSPSKALTAYKVVPSAQQNLKDDAASLELSLCIREEIVKQALQFPENDFIEFAKFIFEMRQNDLIPSLVSSLETLHTPQAIAVLKHYYLKAGAPLIRNYCNLALYRLKEEGPYTANLRSWVVNQHQIELIQFRPSLPWDSRDEESEYELTPQETSRLLIESFEALTQHQDDEGISALLDAIQYGSSKNKYALTGLLMRASQ